MTLAVYDRVRETTTTTGTGTITLLGAVIGYQTFNVVGNGNTTYYTIAGQGTAEWEVGIGTFTLSGTTLARTTVLSNSLGTTALISFSAGTKDVFVTYPSEKAVYLDASGNITPASVTSVSGTAPISVATGTTTPAISISQATTTTNGYLSSTDWNTFNNKGSGTVTSVTGTAPVVSSGGATPAISMAAANTTTNGYLTSTDWNTFNGKGDGSVTSVSGTGTVSGLTLTGTVTTTGSLTLGGTLSLTSGNVTTALGFTPYNATNPNSYIALGSAITGYTAGTNTALVATDTVLAALGKLQGQVTATGIPSGTLMLFQQTAAPTGWTKQTTHDNKALRVVSGTASSGGSVAFTTAFASQAVSGTVGSTGAFTLATANIPAHAHTINDCAVGPGGGATPVFYRAGYGNTNTQNTGGGGGHSHSGGAFTGTAIDLAVSYVDLIIASKN